MLLKAILTSYRAALTSLLILGLLAGGLEASFVLMVKRLFTGNLFRDSSLILALGVLTILVSSRLVVQMLSARIEANLVFGFVKQAHQKFLEDMVTYALPWARSSSKLTLSHSLDHGIENLSQGIGAGLRCLAAVAHAIVLVPLLFLFSWKLAAVTLLLSIPAMMVSGLRAKILNQTGKNWEGSKNLLRQNLDAFSNSLESHLGNGRLKKVTEDLSKKLAEHGKQTQQWEWAKAIFPPALEWFFFIALAILAVLAERFKLVDNSFGGTLELIPFGALLLLLYKPIREWARHYPLLLLGNEGWNSITILNSKMEKYPHRKGFLKSDENKIKLKNLYFAYDYPQTSRWVLDDFSFELDSRGLTWITGNNGCGKSTLLKILAGIENVERGSIYVPESFREFSGSHLQSHMGYLPQNTVVEYDWIEWMRKFQKNDPDSWTRLDIILEITPILNKINFELIKSGFFKSLSGGEKQRFSLARVFASPKNYLLLDEPTTWLSAESRERILRELLIFWTDKGRGAAIVSHEKFVGDLCSQSLQLTVSLVKAAAH